MRSVPFIQEWIEQGVQEGRQKGQKEGLQQGLQKGLKEGLQEGYTKAYKEIILSTLENKFGIVKPALLDELDEIKRAESLKMLLNRTKEVQTQEDFLALIKLAVGE